MLTLCYHSRMSGYPSAWQVICLGYHNEAGWPAFKAQQEGLCRVHDMVLGRLGLAAGQDNVEWGSGLTLSFGCRVFVQVSFQVFTGSCVADEVLACGSARYASS